ncbi:hypothetical protein BH11PLA2_BH11PLA2_28800 [soil metagenome]
MKWSLSFAIIALTTSAFAQSPSTAENVKPLFDAFASERAANKGSPETLAAADKLAALAEAARKTESFTTAGRLIRDARWALPATPTDLPEGIRVLGYSRLRSADRVNSVNYSADGTKLLTAAADRTVRIWDLANGHEIIVYRGHTPANTEVDPKQGVGSIPIRVGDAVFHPDGKRVASAGGKQIHLWDLATGKTLQVIKGVDDKKGPTKLIKSIAFNDDGSKLVSGGDDLIVRVWDVAKGEELFTSPPHSSRIEAVAWQPKGNLIAAVDADGFLTVYDTVKKASLMKTQITEGGSVPAYAVRFTADGTKVLTGGGDKIPRLTPVPAADGTVPPNLAAATTKLPASGDDVLAVGVTKDGKHFASAGKDKIIRVVDAAGQPVRQFSGHTSVITALAMRPDSNQIASASDDGSVRVWDLDPIDEHRAASEAKEPLWAVAVASDGSRFAAAGADKLIRVYAATGKLEQTLEGSKAAVTALLFLTDEKLLSVGGDKLIRVWDAKTGKALGNWPGHASAVLALAVKPDGKLVVSGSADKSVIGWNPETGKALWTWTARSVVSALAVRKDGLIVVGTADGGLTVLRIEGDKPAIIGYVNAHVSGVAATVISPDGERLATVGGDGFAKIWQISAAGLPTGDSTFNNAVKAITGTSPLSAVAFSTDGKLLATAGADRVIHLWDSRTGAEVRILRGATDWVTALAFVAGDRLLAVGADKTARLFDIPRITSIISDGHTQQARTVSINKDGTQAVSVGDDRVARVWNLKTGTEAAILRGATERLFTVTFTKPGEVAAGGADRRLRTWIINPAKEIAATPVGEIYSMMSNSDGSKLGVWSRTGDADTYAIYDLAAPPKAVGDANPFRPAENPFRSTALASINEKGRKVSAASFAWDLSIVVSGDESGGVLVWDVATKATVGNEWKLLPGKVADLGLSPDGKLVIALKMNGEAVIANRETRETVATVKGPTEGVNGLVIAPGGNRFAILGSEREVAVFDFAGKELKKWTFPVTANGAAFTSDGKSLITANADGTLFVMNVP